MQAIATIQREQGRLDEALRGHTRVLAVREQKFGPTNRTLLPPLLGLAQIHGRRGELESARRLAARAEAVRATLGVDAQFRSSPPCSSACNRRDPACARSTS